MAKRRGPPWRFIGVSFAVITIAAMSAAFWIRGADPAPRDPGVCWRMTGPVEKPRFERMGRDILNLETCAAHLERQYLIHGGEITGAYQGRYIFIDSQAIRSATSLNGSRWRVFFGPQRDALDVKLKQGGKSLSVVTGPRS